MRSGRPRTSWWLGSMTPDTDTGWRGQNRGIWTGWRDTHPRGFRRSLSRFCTGARTHARKVQSGTTVSIRGLCPPVWSGTRHVPDLLTRRTAAGWMADQISSSLRTKAHDWPQNTRNFTFRTSTINRKNMHLALDTELMMSFCDSMQTHWDRAQPEFNVTRRNWYDREINQPTAAHGKESLSFCQHQCLAQIPVIPHVAMVRTGWGFLWHNLDHISHWSRAVNVQQCRCKEGPHDTNMCEPQVVGQS